jgi:hypothetical protein
MTVLIFSMPFVTLAQESSERPDMVVAAEADAKRDANADVNKLLWFGAGALLSGVALVENYSFLFSIGGLIGSYFYQPNPPAARFVGKSPEYVNSHSETYKKEAGKLHALWSTAGCVSGGIVITGCVFVGFASYGVVTAIAEQE